MTEPGPGTLRQTAMRLTTTLAVTTVALLATGCGQQPGGSTTEGGRSENRVGSCLTTDAGVVHALPIYQAIDLDHDGGGEAMMVTRPDSTCPNIMYSKVGDRFASLDLKDVRLDLKAAHRVIVPGRKGDLMAIPEVHPRGGYQLHLYGYADGRLTEVRTPDGGLPVPFVATDTKGSYLSASCTNGGLVVRQAVTHKPPGVVFAWDIKQTSYRLDGTTARPGPTKEIKDNVLDHDLAKDYPALVHRKMFKDGCGA